MSGVTEADLHAYVDGALEPERRVQVEAWLAGNPDQAERAAAFAQQNARLHAVFDPVLEEAAPDRFKRPPRTGFGAPLMRYAAVVTWVAIGAVVGWTLRGERPAVDRVALPRQAAIAHVVYTPEVRHPVEVGADQQDHLVKWLSKRLGGELKAPVLSGQGYELVGGRLLAGEGGPVAHFMYQDARGQRLTLYVRRDAAVNRETAFRFAQEGSVGVFYWIDGPFGYALTGELPKQDLERVATAVYGQLNP